MRKSLLLILNVLIVALLLIQFIPVKRNNPTETAALQAPEAVAALLQRSCYDCHSNRTHWPWYSRIAPVSWLVSHDVQEGREELNFSQWGKYDDKKKNKMLHEIVEEVEKGKMPLKIYTLMHPHAKISETDLLILRDWLKKEIANRPD
ncbi:MAG: heme-binding domain-containing protein [Calditrichia bacterium]